MKKPKTKISFDILGLPHYKDDVKFVEVPDMEGALPFFRIDVVGKHTRVLKTKGFMGDWIDDTLTMIFHRNDDVSVPNVIRSNLDQSYAITKYVILNADINFYSLEQMEDGGIRLCHSKEFFDEYAHRDIQGFKFVRITVE